MEDRMMVDGIARQELNLLFVIDNSGSMEGEKINYSVMFHINGHSRRMIVIRPAEIF